MISIIVPLYNAERTIKRLIDSVHRQTIDKWELLLIDDGSTDGTQILCQEYAVSDDRIKYIQKSNGGVSSARNMGLSICTGDWVMFADSDDYLESIALETLEKSFSPQIDILVFGFKRSPKNHIVLPSEIEREYKSLEEISIDADSLFTNNFFHPVWNKAYKKSILSE